MTEEPRKAASIFGDITEADRIAALDLFGKMLIHARDRTIVHWDHTIDGKGHYPPWERLLQKVPDLDERSREIIRQTLPHIVDTFMYCLLDGLESHNTTIRVSVSLEDETIPDLHRISWGLPAEPTGENGWLVRFSKQRFEQPT